ncbi:hypothetical protein SAMN05216480_10928 [Pustulibacterium marinum]|uniref:Uncharacterized protein n=1 Tax=Pustulibacterium marinum TaxID=1224947 RepID=A0A1I7HGD0_9FLAO|nr:hypothetical protein [Pustulibacterium marinum]SFU59609.1 hypothetical protein SAMN05216480_10928 [Pustulibacterium marinum]
MKKKNYKRLVKQLKSELTSKNGPLKSAGYNCNGKPMKKGEFLIGDNDELMFTISCLLKTCILALEGDANFSLSTMNKADPKASVIVSLEFINSLLPREQMVVLDKISELLK